MGEEGVEEDMVLCPFLFLVQSLCSSGREWSKGQSGGRSLLGLCLTLIMDVTLPGDLSMELLVMYLAAHHCTFFQ